MKELQSVVVQHFADRDAVAGIFPVNTEVNLVEVPCIDDYEDNLESYGGSKATIVHISEDEIELIPKDMSLWKDSQGKYVRIDLGNHENMEPPYDDILFVIGLVIINVYKGTKDGKPLTGGDRMEALIPETVSLDELSTILYSHNPNELLSYIGPDGTKSNNTGFSRMSNKFCKNLALLGCRGTGNSTQMSIVGELTVDRIVEYNGKTIFSKQELTEMILDLRDAFIKRNIFLETVAHRPQIRNSEIYNMLQANEYITSVFNLWYHRWVISAGYTTKEVFLKETGLTEYLELLLSTEFKDTKQFFKELNSDLKENLDYKKYIKKIKNNVVEPSDNDTGISKIGVER